MDKEEVKQENDSITIVEHEGKLFFSDEFENDNLNHPLYIPE